MEQLALCGHRRFAVMLRVGFGCFRGMVSGVMQVPLRHLRVMRSGVVIPGVVV
jgi:hypothetical protein